MRLNPLTARKLRRFKSLKRGYYSFWLLIVLTVLSLVAELLVNDKAIAVRYEGEWSFPTYSAVRLGSEFGLQGEEANTPVSYRELKKVREDDNSELIASMTRRHLTPEQDAQKGPKHLVYFSVEKVLPLIGSGEPQAR